MEYNCIIPRNMKASKAVITLKYTGNNVRKIRTDLDIPIKTFLSELEINKSTFCKKERGDLKFNLIEAYTISIMFQMSIEDIFFTV